VKPSMNRLLTEVEVLFFTNAANEKARTLRLQHF